MYHFMKTSILLATVASLLIQTTYASETDAFTFRYYDIADSTDILDQEINRRMNEAMDRTNYAAIESSGTCNVDLLFKNLTKQFHRPIYGKVEGWIKRHKEIPHARVPVRKSIFRDIPFWKNLPVHAGKMGLGPVIRLNGQLVGNDKIGHFFDEGLHNYHLLQEGKSIADAVAYGVETETGIFGLKATGVYSYADTVANFNGLNYWYRIMGSPLTGTGDSYFTCDQGTLKRNVSFTFRDYVDAGWDEGINCSEYRDEEYKTLVINQIKRLEENDAEGRAYQCPVIKTACDEIAPKYGEYAKDILNPSCRQKN
jgi:hypothetical protein